MKNLLLLFAALALCISAHADTFTITVTGVTNTTYSVPSNVVAKVTYAACWAGSNPSIRVTIGTNWINVASAPFNSGGTFGQTNLPTVVGPATISLANSTGGASAFSYCVIETSPASPAPIAQTPSNAVVIPCDNNGPVNIILESSVDLVNWTAALPGTYGTTASNRFFRVRASR